MSTARTIIVAAGAGALLAAGVAGVASADSTIDAGSATTAGPWQSAASAHRADDESLEDTIPDRGRGGIGMRPRSGRESWEDGDRSMGLCAADTWGHGEERGAAGGPGSSLPEVSGEVSPAEAESLAAMAEEERFARDLYVTLAETWELRELAMISRAEQHHLDAVTGLLRAWGLEDPAEGADPGEFADADLQDLFDRLAQEGAQSPTAALRVGALVEETDIADLREQDVDADAITRVYDRLERGSERHLSAFVRALDRAGETYVAQVLDPADVEDITGVPAP